MPGEDRRVATVARRGLALYRLGRSQEVHLLDSELSYRQPASVTAAWHSAPLRRGSASNWSSRVAKLGRLAACVYSSGARPAVRTARAIDVIKRGCEAQ